MQLFKSSVKSPIGTWVVEGDDRVVTRVYMPHEPTRASTGTPPKAVKDAATQLSEYFAGTRKKFTVKLAPTPSTEFQRDVWDALVAIPYGQVRTYGDVAAAVGRPRATRAVGNANHVNPWPVLVPCHRVVGAAGLGGYGGGVDVKTFLLDLEGATY
ncbi:MAG TPA: methylated-DNA--[protein]-cysteine S-methyltransferase [Acidimicrobiales bacterium]|nr:methylated-DNA--[protein]-cysteine S-methyltransferase [Acidimicrobiales bacterium]